MTFYQMNLKHSRLKGQNVTNGSALGPKSLFQGLLFSPTTGSGNSGSYLLNK